MQKKNLKKIFYLVVLVVLFCSIFINIVQAVNEIPPDPGSDGDPIVSKSYVDASVAGITAQIQQLQLLQDKYNQLLQNYDVLKKQLETSSVKGYEFIPIEQGQKFFAGLGTEIIVISGKANSIKGNSGGLIDTNTAKQLLTVSPIAPNHLLISAANDGRGLYTVTKCYLLIKGTYKLDSKPTDIPIEIPEKPTVKPTEKPTVKPTEKPTEKPTVKDPDKTPDNTESIVGTGIVNTAILNLREKADVNSKIITKLSKGQTVSIINFTDEWYNIKTSNGLYGWTLGKYITLKD